MGYSSVFTIIRLLYLESENTVDIDNPDSVVFPYTYGRCLTFGMINSMEAVVLNIQEDHYDKSDA